ncbi:MAG: TIGR00282 family metallophosphoesterase [Acidobacteria bacterium]|nr:MAG: TIGR00282 family metallophosphoesterase [Acidobacteriota bacterium]REK10166.1 MAG: TIGR00282 family metallophosphoesterase [Acidobacteriota bacterium]
MRILFVGDVIGRPGRRALRELLPELRSERSIDYTVVNIENAAGGFGVNPGVLEELADLEIDCYTTGNHVWDKRDGLSLLEQHPNLLRPANYPRGNPGSGLYVGETATGEKIATINLEGQVFMKPLPSPFEAADRLLERLPDDVRVVLVDFHAEATSEKQAMGFHLDGRVTAVVGTHTHVPTADARVLPGGTALQTDVGMTGPYESIIGFRHDKVLRRFALQRNAPFEVAKRDVRVAACIVDADAETGRARSIEALLIPFAG